MFLGTEKRQLGEKKGNKASRMRPQVWFRQRFLTLTMVEGERGISVPLCIIMMFLRTNLRGSGQVWFREGAGQSSSPPRSRWDSAASKPRCLRSQSQHPPTDAAFNTAGRVAPAVIEMPALGEVVRLNSSGVGHRLVFAGSLAPAGTGFGQEKCLTWLLGL